MRSIQRKTRVEKEWEGEGDGKRERDRERLIDKIKERGVIQR